MYLAVLLVVMGASYALLGTEPETEEETQPDLFTVLLSGDLVALKAALDEGADPNEKDSRGRTPLHWALLGLGKTPTVYGQVKALVAAGANPNITDRRGRTALHFAAQYGGGNAVTQALLDAGGDPDIKAQANISPLKLAALEGDAGARAALEAATSSRPSSYDQLKAVGDMMKRFEEATTEVDRKAVLGRDAGVLVQRGWMTEEEKEAMVKAILNAGCATCD